jgi:hypothetical protein
VKQLLALKAGPNPLIVGLLNESIAPSTLANCENTANESNQKPVEAPAFARTCPAPSLPRVSGGCATSWIPVFRRVTPPEVVDPLTVNPPLPAGLGPGSLAPFSEHESDEVGVPPEAGVGEGEKVELDDVVLAGEAVDVLVVDELVEREVGETVELLGDKVVVSEDELSTPLTSVMIMVSPSVTVVSGTPPSVAGVVVGVGEGEGPGAGCVL